MDGEKYKSMMGEGVVGMGVEGHRGGGVYCLLEVPEGAVVRLMSCNAPLKASRLLWTNTLEGSLFMERSCICLYLCGWLDLVWLCPGMRYWLGLMSKRLFVILYMVVSLASALLCSSVGQERAEAKVDPDVSQL